MGGLNLKTTLQEEIYKGNHSYLFVRVDKKVILSFKGSSKN